jgi:nucleoside 2-deoxyribosyltransferase
MSKSIYLAGPEVFFADSHTHFDALEALCVEHGVRGVRPSDGGLSKGVTGTGDEVAERIYRTNVELIRECDALLANLMPFRNALEPDSGTVFELGMAVALGKPVAAVVPALAHTYEAKVIEHCGITRDARGLAWDKAFGFMIEEFAQPLNLMLSRSTRLFVRCEDAITYLTKALR